VCSIAPTQRRRFFWAAWWTDAPSERPFRKPDASNGGARTLEAALAEAEAVTGRTLVTIEPRWARAWMRVLRGQPPWTPREEELMRGGPDARARASKKPSRAMGEERATPWTVLGLAPGATEEEIRRAHRRRALETHPDRGGDPEVFRAVQRAYERLLEKARAAPRRKRR
jgi:hypothetical protein